MNFTSELVKSSKLELAKSRKVVTFRFVITHNMDANHVHVVKPVREYAMNSLSKFPYSFAPSLLRPLSLRPIEVLQSVAYDTTCIHLLVHVAFAHMKSMVQSLEVTQLCTRSNLCRTAWPTPIFLQSHKLLGILQSCYMSVANLLPAPICQVLRTACLRMHS